MIHFTLLDPVNYKHLPWKNGGGVSIDIASDYMPGAKVDNWDGVIWCLRRTVIEAPGPFSDLTGFDRVQAVVTGSGLVLETPDGEIDVRKPMQPVRFAGETRISSRLEAGRVEVVNLIGNRSLVAIDLKTLKPDQSVKLLPGIHVVYAPHETVFLNCNENRHTFISDKGLRIDTNQEVPLRCVSGTALLASALKPG